MTRPSIPILANRIRNEVIAAKDLQPGDRLPTVRALGKEFGVTPSRILHAVIALEESGEIVRRHGSGCYVKNPRPKNADVNAKSLALLVPRHRRRSIVPALMESMLSAAADRDFTLQMRETGLNAEQEHAALQRCFEEGCRALILYPHENRPETDDFLINQSPPIPMILVGEPNVCPPHLPRVAFDQEGCGMQMAETLHEHGLRRIAFWHVEDETGRRLAPAAETRYHGLLRSQLLEHLEEWDVRESSKRPDQQPDETLASAWLERWIHASPSERPDCFWALEDTRAALLLRLAVRMPLPPNSRPVICGADNLHGHHGIGPHDFPTTLPNYGKLARSVVHLVENALNQPNSVPTCYLLDLPVIWPPEQST